MSFTFLIDHRMLEVLSDSFWNPSTWWMWPAESSIIVDMISGLPVMCNIFCLLDIVWDDAPWKNITTYPLDSLSSFRNIILLQLTLSSVNQVIIEIKHSGAFTIYNLMQEKMLRPLVYVCTAKKHLWVACVSCLGLAGLGLWGCTIAG